MKTLISFIFIMLVTTSFSIAQSNKETESRLLAKAETGISTERGIIKDGDVFKRNFENPPNKNAEINSPSTSGSDEPGPTSTELNAGSSDISLLVKNELKAEQNLDLTYESPSLKAEDLPLVMSSADKKTISVVMPPFLYFKKQF